MRIYKYPISVADEFSINMPAGSTVLCVQIQRDAPCVWAMVDPTREEAPVRFRIVGTGHDFDLGDDERYVVWHLFVAGA